MASPLRSVLVFALLCAMTARGSAHIVDGGKPDAPPVIPTEPVPPPADGPPPEAPAAPPAAPGPEPAPAPAPPTGPEEGAPTPPPETAPTPDDQRLPAAPAPPQSPPGRGTEPPTGGKRAAVPLAPEAAVKVTPDGVRPRSLSLVEINAIADAGEQLTALAAMFGELLSSLDPDLRLQNGGWPSPYKVVDRHRDRLTDRVGLLQALDTAARVELARSQSLPEGVSPPTAAELAHAKAAFLCGIAEVEPFVPRQAAEALLHEPLPEWIWLLLALLAVAGGVYAWRTRSVAEISAERPNRVAA